MAAVVGIVVGRGGLAGRRARVVVSSAQRPLLGALMMAMFSLSDRWPRFFQASLEASCGEGSDGENVKCFP